MATKNVATKKGRKKGPKGKTLKVEHLTNSLAHIEDWCRYVREALLALDPGMPLPTVSGAGIEKYIPPPMRINCPPEEED